MTSPEAVLQYGNNEPLPERLLLRAGPLSLFFEAGDLRYVKWGEREVIRRIYAAVRDQNWGTVPMTPHHEQREIGENSFRIAYDAEHRQGDIHFVWRGEIVGEKDGTIRFIFDGEAKTTFLRNRIGFCVLHPIRKCAGAPCRIERTDGSTAQLHFPRLVAAEQPVKGMHDLRGMAHEVASGVWAEVRFEGDVFETEDQRNWIDASYKTFCTPLRLPFPVEIKAGTKVRQSVTLRLLDHCSSRREATHASNAGRTVLNAELGQSFRTPTAAVDIEICLGQTRFLPSLGLGIASHGHPLTQREIARLSELHLSHLRADVKLAASDWPDSFRLAKAQSQELGVPIELAVHLPPAGGEPELTELTRRLRSAKTEVVRVMLFRDGEKTTSPVTFDFARSHFTFLECPMGVGTNADFYQLNQFRPPHERADFICWSMNPQVHAFDNVSLAETPTAIPAQIESAREYFPGKALVVSPITLRPRFNPVATGKENGPLAGKLPPQVDPRQMSLFGAGWTLAAFKRLAESGVDSVTFYETIGWRGVMETQAGSALPDKFPSMPGAVFPLYHVVADVGEFSGGEVVACKSSDSLAVEGMVLRKGTRMAVLLANMTGKPQIARVSKVRSPVKVRLLGDANVLKAMTEPEQFRAHPGETRTADGARLEIELRPYGLARIDVSQ